MEWIPPELREDTGELEASLKNQIPRLLESKDIKADLQIHSDFNVETSHDLGESTMEELVEKANNLGYEYIAFTEHNPSHSRHSENQIIDIIKRKKEAIEKLNYSLIQKKDNSVKNVNNRIKKVFNSLEIDILPNGELAISDKALELLDFALVSIHSSFDQERNIATQRVLSALNHPKVKIFAHPTGRRLNEREGVEYDWLKIFDECKKRNIWLEINADPTRLDLPDFLVKEAIENNVKLTLGTDAHNFQCLDNMQYGIYVARRGWATKENLINYLTVDEFEKVIE
ncbi:MAG TPA: PHP domain-containing protein, partial [Patescibacteria group bacterium]|nr:PHP domain-containing protein [Patescibacteria group bacterium]